MEESDHVLKVLVDTKNAIKREDNIKLKELSNQTIHSASISQDANSIAIAVIVYSLSKIIEREKIQKYRGWDKFYTGVMKSIDKSILSLKKNDDEGFKEALKEIREGIDNLSGDLKKNIQNVFRKASINKASKVYEHGISMEKTSKLLGITMFDLATYAGQTDISDVKLSRTDDVKSRIKLAMRMFG